MTIDEVHETLERAAQAAFGFLNIAPTEQVVILRRLCSNHFMTVDKSTFLANRSTLKHQASCVIFMGTMSDLATIAYSVPPSLFSTTRQAPPTAESTPNTGGK